MGCRRVIGLVAGDGAVDELCCGAGGRRLAHHLDGIAREWSKVIGRRSVEDPYSILPQSVRFRVDGSRVATDTAAPFRVRLDTTAYPPGRHTLTAIGRRGLQRVRTAVTVRFLDSRPPSTPDGLVVDATDSSLTLGWLASTDNLDVAAYRLHLDGAGAGSTTALTHAFLHLACNSQHRLGVSAVDAARCKAASVTPRSPGSSSPTNRSLSMPRCARAAPRATDLIHQVHPSAFVVMVVDSESRRPDAVPDPALERRGGLHRA
jgi:hypothetical protein